MVFSLFCFILQHVTLYVALILLGPCLMCTWLNCWPTVHNADHLKWTLYLNIAHDVFEKNMKLKVQCMNGQYPYMFVLQYISICAFMCENCFDHQVVYCDDLSVHCTPSSICYCPQYG